MIRPCIHTVAFMALLTAIPFAQISVTLQVEVGGKKRSAVLRVPAGAVKPPVVFYVHGATDSPEWFKKNGNTDATADREKYLAIYTCADSDCQGGVWQDVDGTSNFPYFFALLDSVDARYKIDRSRVYMVGFSQGGHITTAAACNYSDVFAAVAPVSGNVSEATPCAPKRPIPLYLTFGTQEGWTSDYLKSRDRWLKLDKCPTTGTTTKPYPASLTTSKRTRHVFSPCEGNTQVIMDSISGQGHYWPRSSNGSQADEIWAFLKQYTLPQATATSPPALAQSGVPITVSYASGLIRLGGLREEAQVEVTDTQGKRIAAGKTRQHSFTFAGPSRGVYLVTVRGAGSSAARKIILP